MGGRNAPLRLGVSAVFELQVHGQNEEHRHDQPQPKKRLGLRRISPPGHRTAKSTRRASKEAAQINGRTVDKLCLPVLRLLQ